MKVKKVLELLENAEEDTVFSKDIFDNYEEGLQDKQIKEGDFKRNRRDWLIIADIYNEGKYTQRFHLWNFLQFKLHNKKITLDSEFTYSRIRNGALMLYIKEVLMEEKVEELYESVKAFYSPGDMKKINHVPLNQIPLK